MVSQIRTYTINKGMMDSWLELFDKEIRPVHDSLGIPIVATWVNADRTDFIWVRSFDSVEEIEGKEAAYFASPGRKALGDKPTSHIARMDVRVVEEVLAPVAVA
ncbi:MAG: NIPSNAP family protein [Chloroflexi bacterium]|nr:NIPSNAP family protein [Chloroflexota bacterium]MDA1271612.1 NIPSNAP family protein [Chloroflexota bacterium]